MTDVKQSQNTDEQVEAPKMSAAEALELSKKQPGLPGMIRLFQVLVLCIFGSGFVGFYKGYKLIQSLAALTPSSDEYLSAMQSFETIAGPLVSSGALGSAMWFMLSSLCGGLGVIIPFAVYNFIARRGEHSRFPGSFGVMYDAIKAEVYKYSLMVIILGSVFKFTSLSDMITISTFVIMMCVQLIISSYSLGFASQKEAQEATKEALAARKQSH